MPLASLLCYAGQSQTLLGALLQTAGQTLFSVLPLIIAMQLANALQRGESGQQPLNAAVGYLILSSTLQTLAPE